MKTLRIICISLIILFALMVAIFATWFLTSKNYIGNFQSNKSAINTTDNTIKNQKPANQENPVISPKKGDVFTLGQSVIKIQWDTNKINAYHIDIVPGEGNIDAPPYVSIYGWNPQPQLPDGEFIFTYLDRQSGFMPGNYKIKLQSPDKTVTLYSDEFTIASPVPMLPRVDKMFYIYGLLMDHSPNQQYSQNDTLYATVDAREGDGSYATPEGGFTLAVGIFNTDENGTMINYGRSIGVISPEDNMRYDYSKHVWEFGVGPFVSLECNRWYDLRTELTCGSFDISSPCVQRYRYYHGKAEEMHYNNVAIYSPFYVTCK